MRASRAILVLLAAVGVFQILHYYPLLPERIASHFNGSGEPNGFQSRNGFVVLSASMLILTVVLFGGLGALFQRIPSKWFNLPNRGYWLAPDRRQETLDFISTQMEWFGAASLALYLFVIRLVVQTNETPQPRLPSGAMFFVLGLYLVFTVVWISRFLLRFRMPGA